MGFEGRGVVVVGLEYLEEFFFFLKFWEVFIVVWLGLCSDVFVCLIFFFCLFFI